MRVNSDELSATVAEQQKKIFQQQILARERTFTDLMQGDWGEISQWLATVKAFVVDTRGLERVSGLQWMLLGSLALFGVVLGWFGKRRLLAVLPRPTDKDDLIFLAVVAFGASLAHTCPGCCRWPLPAGHCCSCCRAFNRCRTCSCLVWG